MTRRQKQFLAALSILIGAILVWFGFRAKPESEGVAQGDPAPPTHVVPTSPLRYRDLMSGPDGNPMPSIQVGFVDERGNPIALDTVSLMLGCLKPLDPSKDNFDIGLQGNWAIDGANGFKTALAIGDGRNLYLRFLKADTYFEIVDGDGRYEVASFRTPPYQEGKLDYSVLVILHPKKNAPPVPEKQVILRGIAPPVVDGIREYEIIYTAPDGGRSNATFKANAQFLLEIKQLGGSLVAMYEEGPRVVGFIEPVTSTEVGVIPLMPPAKTYRVTRAVSRGKEGVLFYPGKTSTAILGGCGFDDPEALEATLILPPGTYWGEHIGKDPETKKDVSGPRFKITLGEETLLDFDRLH